MITPKVFDSEYNFCLVLWEHEPITASDIAKICKELDLDANYILGNN